MSGSKPWEAFVASRRHIGKRSVNELISDLQTTINKALPTVSIGYERVSVLSISWSNDTRGVKMAESELLDVFERIYGFTVQTHVIRASSNKSQATRALAMKTAEFIEKCASKDSLVIIIYSGLSALAEGPRPEYLIAGREYQKTPDELYIDWAAHSTGLDSLNLDWMSSTNAIPHAEGDVLCILDAPFPNHLARHQRSEILAAANCASLPPKHILDTSFTTALAAQLRLLNGKPCSISQLFGALHSAHTRGRILETPLHMMRPQRDSIVLQKIETRLSTRRSGRRTTMAQAGRRHGIEDLRIGMLGMGEERVLVSVRLERDTGMDLAACKRCLVGNLPGMVHESQVTVEGLWGGMVLVAMPVVIWTALPVDDSAYRFVSFIKSGAGVEM